MGRDEGGRASRLPRVDAYERVSGSAVYPLDFALPDMLHAAILRCPHAHARVKSVDTSAAEKMPGRPRGDHREDARRRHPVVPRPRRSGTRSSSTTARGTRGTRWPPSLPRRAAQAYDALKAIKVEYEELAFVLDPREALKADAPLLHEGTNRYGDPAKYERGDVDAGFAAADAVVEGTYSTACEIHTPMEVHGSVAKWDGNRLTVWDTTQGVFAVQQAVAGSLKLPLANVRVIGHYMGGGFGSKLEAGKYTVIAALLAKMTARPVKLFLSREETFLAAGNRPAEHDEGEGRREEGRDADRDRVLLDRLGRGLPERRVDTSFLATDLYTCPNVRTVRRERRDQRGPCPRVSRPRLPAGGLGARAGDGRARREARNGPGRAAARRTSRR